MSAVRPLASMGVNVRDYGAVGNGTTDDTAAIQAALDVVISHGGIVYIPSGTYLITSSLSFGDNSQGVRLIGEANGYFSPTQHGTILKWTGAGACIDVPGSRSFEVADLVIWGADSGEDGIKLHNGVANTPQNGLIRNVRVSAVTGKCLNFERYSYVTVDGTITNGGTHSLFTPHATDLYQEFLWVRGCGFDAASVCGISISGGAYISIEDCNVTHSGGVGVLIGGAGATTVYQVHMARTVIDYSTTYGLEINAESGHMGRMSFRDMVISLSGESASEKAIYIHRTIPYTTFYTVFDTIEVLKLGTTAPTTAIDLTDVSEGCSFYALRNTSGGAIADHPLMMWEPSRGLAAPTTGTHLRGEIVWNAYPDNAVGIGWVCITAGAPGIWTPFGFAGTPAAHIEAASQSHALNAAFSDTEVESALNALGAKVNAILVALEGRGIVASS